MAKNTFTDFITISEEVRTSWFDENSLDERLNDINTRIRALMMAMAGRDIKVVPFEIRLCGDHNEVLYR
jgi:hypothetical protein